MRTFVSSVATLMVLVLCGGTQADQPRQTTAVDIFVGGVGYPNYRIPTLATALDGTLIAIVEGRTGDDAGFGGDTDLVMKRSFDNGATWSGMSVIESPRALYDEKISNPATVVDQTNGRVWVLYNRFEGDLGTTDSLPGTTNNTAWARYSDDSGASWSTAIDITTAVKDYNNWNTVAFGPGSGIQASDGRLIVPSARWQAGQGWSSYAVYSDNNGATWQRGALSSGSNLSNENSIVQLANGQIMMDGRQNSGGDGSRVKYLSNNGGATWLAPPMPGQYAPSVHAALARYTLQSAGDDINRLLWTGPRGPDRYDLVVRTSYNEGSSFTNERLLFDGYSGYSDTTLLNGGGVGLLFETNQARSITYTSINHAFIEPPDGLLAYDDFRYASANILGSKNGGYGFSGGWAGNAGLSGVANPIIEASDLHYTNFPFVTEGNRRPVFFNFAGGSMSRALATPLDLGADETYYFTLLIRQDNTGTDEENSTEQFEVSFLNGTNKVTNFGVQGDESLYVENASTRIATAADSLTKGTVYYLVGKIEASASSFDQIFLSAFQSGEPIPATDAGMAWALAGTTAMSSGSLLDRLMITSGNMATWVLDELRIGTSFTDVVSNATAVLIGDLDGDGFVGIADLNIVLSEWNQEVPPGNPLADPSGDGFVGIEDLNLVLGNWNAGTPPAAGANIPEPASCLLLASSVIFGLQTRRRGRR